MVTLRASWPSHPAVAAASRPVRVVVPVHPLGGQGPSPSPLKIQARTRDLFRFQCQKDADYHEPEPEPEPELDDYNPDVMENTGVPFVDIVPANSDDPVIEELRKYHVAICAASGMRVPPDMFRNEKAKISNDMMKISSSRVGIKNVNNKVMALTVCAQAQAALDLASMVMDLTDMASLDLGPTEFSKHTANQNAYRKRIKTDTVVSFLDALRGLCSIFHVVVQDTVAMHVDSPQKNRMTEKMERQSHEYYKRANNLKEEYMTATGIEHTLVMEILFYGIKQTESYISQLLPHRGVALGILLGENAKKLLKDENTKRLQDTDSSS